MSSKIYKQIYSNMNLKETDELLKIWRTHDRLEWSETTFEVIREILETRGAEIPEQDEPIYEHAETTEDDTYGFTEIELKIVDDENPPEFYDPLEVMQISKWIEKAAQASIILAVVLGLIELPELRRIVTSYFYQNQRLIPLATPIALGILSVGIIFQIAITYFPLRALAHTVNILMEMEFNSRKAKP